VREQPSGKGPTETDEPAGPTGAGARNGRSTGQSTVKKSTASGPKKQSSQTRSSANGSAAPKKSSAGSSTSGTTKSTQSRPAPKKTAQSAAPKKRPASSGSESNSSASEESNVRSSPIVKKPWQPKKPESTESSPTGKPAASGPQGLSQKPAVSARQPLSRPTSRRPSGAVNADQQQSAPTTTMPAVADDSSAKPAQTTDKASRTSTEPESGEPAPSRSGLAMSAAKTKAANLKEKLKSAKQKARPQADDADRKPSASIAPAGSRPAAATRPEVATDPEASFEPGVTRRLKYVEPWSVTKLAFVVSVALMIVGVVAMTVFWIVLQVTGVWGALNDSVANILSDDAQAFDVTDHLGLGRLLGLTLVLSAINVVFMTALATIAAHLYNAAATILGGINLTFSGDDR